MKFLKVLSLLMLMSILIAPSYVKGADTYSLVAPEDSESLDLQVPPEEVEKPAAVPTNGLFDIEIIVGTQSVWNNKVPLTVRFRTETASNKTEVRWDGPSAIEISPKTEGYFPIVEGQMYEAVTYITPPENPGKYNISSNIIVWQADTNDTTTSRVTLEFDENKKLIPITDKYKQDQLIKYAVIFLLVILLIVGGIFGSKRGIAKLKEWLKPPE